MDKLLKPVKLALDPNSSSATKQWIHWIRTFRSYVDRFITASSSEAMEEDKLAALINCATPEVYEHIDQCKTFSEAEVTLEKLYVKQPNDIFARYLLRMAKQRPDQTLADFKCTLDRLAKDCDFKNVTAAQYRDDLVRDSFITGIISAEIRQRLLEHKSLTMINAYEQAVTIDDAKRDNRLFCKSPSESDRADLVNYLHTEVKTVDEFPVSAVATAKCVCHKCGSNKSHDFKRCRAKSMICFKCGVKGHLSRACHLQKNRASPLTTKFRGDDLACVDEQVSSLQVVASTNNDKLSHATVLSTIKGRVYQTLLDTGSTKCFVRESIAKQFGIEVAPVIFSVGMAQSSSKVQVSGLCRVDLTLLEVTYESVTLYVMKDLCVDVLLGREFLELHKSVVFNFDGNKESLVVPKTERCAVTAAKVETPSLFSTLIRGWRPIATKSRRFNKADKEFIKLTVDKWKQSGTVRPSKSPWRAQCVVVKRQGQIQRLAIDYSQTINLFTEKDAFPIPLIEEIVNDLASFKFYASYDLRKAYHQTPIKEEDKPFTAFEAGAELLEFNVMPFGVTNGGPVFQRIMTKVIQDDRLVSTFVYFDNIIVGANSLSDLDAPSCKFKGIGGVPPILCKFFIY